MQGSKKSGANTSQHCRPCTYCITGTRRLSVNYPERRKRCAHALLRKGDSHALGVKTKQINGRDGRVIMYTRGRGGC